jgi:hypothetical protein
MTTSMERLQHRIEVQSRQLEGFFNRRQMDGRVERGAVRGPWIDFDLPGTLVNGVGRLRDWAAELAENMGVPDVRLQRRNGGLRVSLGRGRPHPGDLLDLLEACRELPESTAVLGRDDRGSVLLLTLSDPEVGNILVAGNRGSGRTSLLRALALSLAFGSRQAQMQLGIIDVNEPAKTPGRRERLLSLAYLPHLMFPLADTIGEAADALNFLAAEMSYRLEEGLERPLMVVIIDNADSLLLRGGEAVRRPLENLMAHGPGAGLRVILSAAEAASPALRRLLRAHVTVRLVGEVSDETQARAASGIMDSYAEYQQGPGAFLAVTYGTIIPFEAAFADSYDAHLILKGLYRRAGPVLLAKRPPPPPGRDGGRGVLYFQRQAGSTVLHEEPAAYGEEAASTAGAAAAAASVVDQDPGDEAGSPQQRRFDAELDDWVYEDLDDEAAWGAEEE